MVDGVMRQTFERRLEATMRDQFAALAMQGIIAGVLVTPNRTADIASQSYAIADAMMDEREKRGGGRIGGV